MVSWLWEDFSYNFSSLLWWAVFALAFLQLVRWKEKQSGKLSIRWDPGENSWFKLLKVGKIPFKWLLMSIIELLILVCYLGVS